MRDSGEVDDGKVWGDLCREKRVNIAYNSLAYFGYFDVDDKTGEMVRYNVYPENVIHPYSHIPSQMEIMDSFFKPHKIIVNWINCNGTYGGYDFEQRKWTGMVGKVRNLFFRNI